MRRAIRIVLGTSLLVLLTGAEPKISVRNVKYDELTREIRGLKGKVVVVDFWGEY